MLIQVNEYKENEFDCSAAALTQELMQCGIINQFKATKLLMSVFCLNGKYSIFGNKLPIGSRVRRPKWSRSMCRCSEFPPENCMIRCALKLFRRRAVISPNGFRLTSVS